MKYIFIYWNKYQDDLGTLLAHTVGSLFVCETVIDKP